MKLKKTDLLQQLKNNQKQMFHHQFYILKIKLSTHIKKLNRESTRCNQGILTAEVQKSHI